MVAYTEVEQMRHSGRYTGFPESCPQSRLGSSPIKTRMAPPSQPPEFSSSVTVAMPTPDTSRPAVGARFRASGRERPLPPRRLRHLPDGRSPLVGPRHQESIRRPALEVKVDQQVDRDPRHTPGGEIHHARLVEPRIERGQWHGQLGVPNTARGDGRFDKVEWAVD